MKQRLHLKSDEDGFTLLEVILALVIGASILLLSIQQYQNFKRDSDITSIQSNTDVLFAALTQYYSAYCADPNHTLGQPSNIPYPVSISTLQNAGFLDPKQLRQNPLVSYAGVAPTGYILQFNPSRMPREVKMSDGTTQPVGTILMWTAQVSVQLAANENAQALQNALGADCLSPYRMNGYVEQCGASTGDFAVFTRTISLPSLRGNPNTWIGRAKLPLFTQMYTTYPILNLVDQNQASKIRSTQFYRCGG